MTVQDWYIAEPSEERWRSILSGALVPWSGVPSASFTITPNPVEGGSPVTFDGSASANAVSWEWDDAVDINDPVAFGTFPLGSGPVMSFTWQNEATRPIRLRVANNAGVTDDLIQEVVIQAATVDPVPSTWQAAWDTQDQATIEAWYDANAGLSDPTVLVYQALTSGPIQTTQDDEIIENLDIYWDTATMPSQWSGARAIEVHHNNVTIRNVKIYAEGAGGGITVYSNASGCKIENCFLDGSYNEDGLSGSAVELRGASPEFRYNWLQGFTGHIRLWDSTTGASKESNAGQSGFVVEYNYVKDQQRYGSVSTSGASYRGYREPDGSWKYLRRNRLAAGSSAGLTMYPRDGYGGVIRELLVEENLFVGLEPYQDSGFGVLGGREEPTEGNYCLAQNVKIDDNRFAGTFKWSGALGEGTNGAVDLARTGNTFDRNQWLPGHGTVVGDLPARCGKFQDACDNLVGSCT